jgi:hypothetical protein
VPGRSYASFNPRLSGTRHQALQQTLGHALASAATYPVRLAWNDARTMTSQAPENSPLVGRPVSYAKMAVNSQLPSPTPAGMAAFIGLGGLDAIAAAPEALAREGRIAGKAARQTWGVNRISPGEVMTRPWYHGGPQAWDPALVDPSKGSLDSLRGPGFYVTDNPRVAGAPGGYAEKGVEDLKYTQMIEQQPGERLDAFRQRVRDYAKNIEARGGANVERKFLKNGYTMGGPAFRARMTVDESSPFVHSFQVTPRKILRTERGTTVPKPQYEQILRALGQQVSERPHDMAMRGAMEEAGKARLRGNLTGADGERLYYALTDNLSPARTNDFLRSLGFDALHYTGGVRQGGHGMHNALAVLNKDAIRPNTSFRAVPDNPRVERMRKALDEHERLLFDASTKAEEAGRRMGALTVGNYDLSTLHALADGSFLAQVKAGKLSRAKSEIVRGRGDPVRKAFAEAFIQAARGRRMGRLG